MGLPYSFALLDWVACDKSPFPQNTQGGYFIAMNGVFPQRGDMPAQSAE